MAVDEIVETISASRLSSFEFCPYSYYLDTIIRDADLPITGLMAKRFWLKNAFSKLIPEGLYVGDEVTYLEDLDPKELAKYLRFKSPEAFANAMFQQWIHLIIKKNGKVHGRDIVWTYNKEWWKAAHEIKKACSAYYQRILEKGLPILGYTGREAAFYFEKRKYVVKFDEIRKGMVLEKQNTSKANQEKIDQDWQITMQILAFCELAHQYEAYRLKWDVNPEIAAAWGGTAVHIDPQVTYRYCSLGENKEIETNRTDSDLAVMQESIRTIQDSVEQAVLQQEFSPNYKHCSVCKYNVLGKDNQPVCRAKKENVKTPKPMSAFD